MQSRTAAAWRARSRAVDRRWPVAAAVAVLAVLWLGPLPTMARTAFSPHMILHIGLVAGAAPLIAAGLAAQARYERSDAEIPLSTALGATVAEMVVVWGWHSPGLHAAAARSDLLFVLQQVSFLGAATLVWFVSLRGRTRRDAAIGAFTLGATFVHMTMLGLILTLAGAPLYPVEICGGAFGLDPLGDQHLGGTLMTVFGAFPYLAGSAVLTLRMLSPARPDAGI